MRWFLLYDEGRVRAGRRSSGPEAGGFGVVFQRLGLGGDALSRACSGVMPHWPCAGCCCCCGAASFFSSSCDERAARAVRPAAAGCSARLGQRGGDGDRPAAEAGTFSSVFRYSMVQGRRRPPGPARAGVRRGRSGSWATSTPMDTTATVIAATTFTLGDRPRRAREDDQRHRRRACWTGKEVEITTSPSEIVKVSSQAGHQRPRDHRQRHQPEHLAGRAPRSIAALSSPGSDPSAAPARPPWRRHAQQQVAEPDGHQPALAARR